MIAGSSLLIAALFFSIAFKFNANTATLPVDWPVTFADEQLSKADTININKLPFIISFII
jgi:hypothetical protein